MERPDSPAVTGDDLPKQLSWTVLVLLHLLPGVGLYLVFLALNAIVSRLGGTTYLALILAIPLALLPLLLGIMLVWSWKTTGAVSLRVVTANLGHAPVYTVFGYALALFLLLAIVSLGTAAISVWIQGNLSWGVEALRSQTVAQQIAESSSFERRLTFAAALIFSGIVAPVVEEIYFRGFLLPRIGFLGDAAPVVNSFLFALQHFYMPWNVPAIFVMWIPIAMIVRKQGDLRIGVVVHCLINISGALGLFLSLGPA